MTDPVAFYWKCMRYARKRVRNNLNFEDIGSTMFQIWLESGREKESNLRWLFIDTQRRRSNYDRKFKMARDPMSNLASIDEMKDFLFEPHSFGIEFTDEQIKTLIRMLGRLRKFEAGYSKSVQGELPTLNLEELRRRAYDQALEKFEGSIEKAALALGVNKSSVTEYVLKHQLFTRKRTDGKDKRSGDVRTTKKLKAPNKRRVYKNARRDGDQGN